MRSRFAPIRRWKLPRHRRSRRLPGAEEDRGRWIKCWHCGFRIDLHSNLGLGDGSGIEVTDVAAPSDNVDESVPWVVYNETPFTLGLLLRNGPSGDPDFVTDVYTPRLATAFAGCPLCGCRNLP